MSLKIGVLGSSNGTDLDAIIDSIEKKYTEIWEKKWHENIYIAPIRKKLDTNHFKKMGLECLRNFYKNNGYYNVSIESSSAKLINETEFELIFNINSGKKYFFDNVSLEIPDDFDEKNFKKINEILNQHSKNMVFLLYHISIYVAGAGF